MRTIYYTKKVGAKTCTATSKHSVENEHDGMWYKVSMLHKESNLFKAPVLEGIQKRGVFNKQ